MVLAARRGDDSLDEAERRLGAMRIATKYPRIAERHFEATGRQAEVIEVKGSVELAPLVGLADGIVDLVATGRTLAENELEVREEIAVCTARLVANRVAHKLRAAEIDALAARLREASAMRIERIDFDGADPAATAARSARAAAACRRRRVGRASSSRRVRDGGEIVVRELSKAFGDTLPERAARRPRGDRGRAVAARRAAARGACRGRGEHQPPSPAPS